MPRLQALGAACGKELCNHIALRKKSLQHLHAHPSSSCVISALCSVSTAPDCSGSAVGTALRNPAAPVMWIVMEAPSRHSCTDYSVLFRLTSHSGRFSCGATARAEHVWGH
jgi:hypothetical protein